MSRERTSPTKEQQGRPEFPRWLIDPDCVDLELERDPDDPLFDTTLDDAETFRHSRHG